MINSNTSVTLTWLPADPSFWNGIIVTYRVEYQRQEQLEFVDNSEQLEYVTLTASIPSLPEHPLVNNPDPRLVSLPLKEESLQLGGLEENFVYQFVVYYENSAGRSEISIPLRINVPPSGSIKHQSITTIELSFPFPQYHPVLQSISQSRPYLQQNSLFHGNLHSNVNKMVLSLVTGFLSVLTILHFKPVHTLYLLT